METKLKKEKWLTFGQIIFTSEETKSNVLSR